MKTALLTAATIVGFSAAASAQGIEPVSTTPGLDVTVGTQDSGIDPLLIAGGVAVVVAGIIIASGDSSDGTN